MFLGFDPGGVGKFGCALLGYDRAISNYTVSAAATVSSVDEACEWSKDATNEAEVLAIGIDTLLFWQTTRSGWRGADQWLKRNYGRWSNSVVSSNGLYGAMSVQGALLATVLRKRWGDALITETHPKLLWAHFSPSECYPRDWDSGRETAARWLEARGISGADSISDDHQLDAVISAWAASQVLRVFGQRT